MAVIGIICMVGLVAWALLDLRYTTVKIDRITDEILSQKRGR